MASRTKIAQRIAELSHEDVAVRRKAALKLGEYGDRAALPNLCAALRDVSWKVQRNAAIALGSFRDPAAIEALTSVFISSPHRSKYRSVRKQALYALGQIGTEQALETIDRVWHGQDNIRDEAVVALRQAGLAAIPTICRALAATHAAVASHAAGRWVTATIALQSLPDRHTQIHKDACDLMFALLDGYGSNIFAVILATERLTPHDKYICLEVLRRRRRSLLLTIYFRETTAYCQQIAANAESEEVRTGALAVLNYTTLTRGSDRPLTAQRNELLRATQTASSETGTDELLRGSGEPDAGNDDGVTEPAGLVARAIRLFKRL